MHGLKKSLLASTAALALGLSLAAVTAWSAAKAKRTLPVTDQMAIVFTKGCAANDLGCTQPFAERSPQILLLGRAAPGAPWSVVQHSQASYGGAEGEKKEQGDYRTPEGLYATLGAVARSDERGKWGSGHIKISYPNNEDMATKAPKPGGGIYIHGGRGRRTAGCVRVLDPPDQVKGGIHHASLTRMLEAVAAKKSAQLPALLLPHYPGRCLAPEGAALPPDCAETLDWIIAHAGAVSNQQVVRVGGMIDPIPGGAPTPMAATLAPADRIPPKVCTPDAQELAALPPLPVRIEGGRVWVGPAMVGLLPPDGQTKPANWQIMKGQVTFWDCNVDGESKAACQDPPQSLESGHVVVLAMGEATVFRSWMGHGIFDRSGGRAVAPFGVGVLEKDGVVVQTPGGPVEYPIEFDVLAGGKPVAACPSGACSDPGLAFDNDDTTAWCGRPGDALVLPHDRSALLAELSLLNGEYDAQTVAMIEKGDRAGAEKRWAGSRRVASLSLQSQESTTVSVADAFGDQVVAVPGGGLCMRDVRVVIESTAGGAPEGCIAEVELRFGNPGS